MRLKILLDEKVVLDKDIGDIDHDHMREPLFTLGELGELIVAEKLKSLGIDTIRLFTNSASDFLLTKSRKLLEVKTARKGYNTTTECFAFQVHRNISQYIIIWAVDIDKFFVLDKKQVKLGVNRIYPNAKKWLNAEGNWCILT